MVSIFPVSVRDLGRRSNDSLISSVRSSGECFCSRLCPQNTALINDNWWKGDTCLTFVYLPFSVIRSTLFKHKDKNWNRKNCQHNAFFLKKMVTGAQMAEFLKCIFLVHLQSYIWTQIKIKWHSKKRKHKRTEISCNKSSWFWNVERSFIKRNTSNL